MRRRPVRLLPLHMTLIGGHRNDVTQLLPTVDSVPPTAAKETAVQPNDI